MKRNFGIKRLCLPRQATTVCWLSRLHAGGHALSPPYFNPSREINKFPLNILCVTGAFFFSYPSFLLRRRSLIFSHIPYLYIICIALDFVKLLVPSGSTFKPHFLSSASELQFYLYRVESFQSSNHFSPHSRSLYLGFNLLLCC